jgi:hypothetical protein
MEARRIVPHMIASFHQRLSGIWAKATPTAVAWAVGGLGVLVYSNALANGFAYDDLVVLVRDPGIHSLASLPGRLLEPYWPMGGREVGGWRPLTTALWGIVWVASSGAAWAFHLFGVLLHGLASALVVVMLSCVMPLGAAAIAGAVFAVHPVHTEAVANVVGSAEAMAAIFVLLACWAHLRGGTRHGTRTVVLIAALYGLGLLTKEGVATLPLALFLLDAAQEDIGLRDLVPYLRRRAPTYLALAGVLAVVLGARGVILAGAVSMPPPLGAEVLVEMPRAWTVVGSWTHYVRLLVFPLDLSADYAPSLVSVAFDITPGVLSGAAQVVGLLLLGLLAWRSGPALSPEGLSSRAYTWGVLWVAAMILPVSNIIFIGGSLITERSFYLPSVGLAAAAGWGAAWIATRSRGTAVVLILLVLGLFAARTVTRTPTWRSTETVFAALIDDHPESGRAQWVLANDLWEMGYRREALQAFRYAVAILDSPYPVLTDPGSRLMSTPAQSPAEGVLRLAWRSNPDIDAAPTLLFALLRRQGRLDEAVAVAREALETAPGSVMVLDQLALGLSEQGLHAEAISFRSQALALGRGELWRWWVAQAQDYAALGDPDGVEGARGRAEDRAGMQGPDTLRVFREVADRIR